MKLHRKAKTTPVSRLLLVSRIEDEHWTHAETAEAFGVSERTVGKWVQRFRLGGVAALEDESSRPGPPTHQTPPLAVYLIGWLRKQHGLPAWAIALALRMPRSTVSRWLQRLGEHEAEPGHLVNSARSLRGRPPVRLAGRSNLGRSARLRKMCGHTPARRAARARRDIQHARPPGRAREGVTSVDSFLQSAPR